MRLGLHDVVLPCAGEPQLAARPAVTDAARATWVRALHARLSDRAADGTPTTLACRGGGLADGVRIIATIRRLGGAVAAVWAVGEGRPAAAASVLLRGAGSADDAAALESLRRHDPRLPIGPGDYDAVAALPRPCLVTFYADARRYDDGSVELLAGALALAELLGPSGSLTVRPDRPPVPQASAAVEPTRGDAAWPAQATRLQLARERLGLLMELVSKKSSAAIAQRPGTHFQVYPPARYLRRPNVLGSRRIFDTLVGTSWLLKWYDGREDRLPFTEFLAFLDQVVECEQAYEANVLPSSTPGPSPPAPRNSNVWPPAPPTDKGKRVLRASGGINLRRLVSDGHIRELFNQVTFESTPSDDNHADRLTRPGADDAAAPPRPRA